MNSIALNAPAKVNLCLSVLGRREDGYHEVDMLMQMVSLYDEVRVAIEGDGIAVECSGEPAPEGESNIAYRAAAAFLGRTGSRPGVRISIRKRIPVAAGLGGGSSNAAAVLAALNLLLGTGLTQGELSGIGQTLGMDVPFFFSGPFARARGRGEVLTRLEPPSKFWVLLVNPGFETSTAWVYQNLNLKLTKKAGCNSIARLTIGNITKSLHNDLEAVTATAHPVVTEIKTALLDLGARGALMSGSGPTVFGIFEREEVCRRASQDLAAKQWRLYPAETLTEPPFMV